MILEAVRKPPMEPNPTDTLFKLMFALFSVAVTLFGYLWGRVDKLEQTTATTNLLVEQRLTRIETKIDRVLVVRRDR